MKWFFTLLFSLIAFWVSAQENNSGLVQENLFHEEEIYASRIAVDESRDKVIPLRIEELPMAVGQMVNQLKENFSKVITYEVNSGKELSKTYFLAVASNNGAKKKIYYDKEGKIAKAITLFD